MHYRNAITLGAALALAACAAGPNYRAPETAKLGVPDAYYLGGNSSTGDGQLTDAGLASWWNRFDEPALDTLIGAAIANNPDIVQAQARLRQAREALIQSRADFFPQIGGSARAGRNYRSGTNGFQTDANGNIISSNSGGSTNSYSVGADASWQIDLFGATRRSVEAAKADLAASGYSLANVRVTIISELVNNYVQARLAQQQIRIANETLKTQQDNYDITRWRVQAGLVSSLDMEQARGQLAQTTASIPALEKNYRAALNRIAVLTGQAPGEATRALETPEPIPQAPTAIATGIPADTLRQRPDVRSAERSLAAATARIGVAKASLFPALSISGNIGTTSTTLKSLGDIVTGGLFANIAQTIFDAGIRTSRIRAQRAATDQAFAAYKSAVLTALEDVENALQSESAARQRAAQFAIVYDAANNSAILARSQYRAGLTDFLTLLTAEQTLLSARNSLASAQSDEALAVVQLYSALGGGWQSMDGKPQ